MAVSMNDDLRTIRADALIEFCGANPKLRIYTAAYALLLAELVCADPMAPAAVAGVITFTPITDGVAVASGTAAIARLMLADGVTVVLEGLTVVDNTGTGEVQLSQAGTVISSGQVVSVLAFVITEGNT